MSTGVTGIGIDPSILLGYYQAQLPLPQTNPTAGTSAAPTTTAPNSATANDNPPWNATTPPNPIAADAKVLSITNFMDTSNVPLTTRTGDAATEQDNQKLFSIYQAINNLTTLANMSTQSTATAGELVGYNNRFQQGLSQVESYLQSTTFNNFTLQTATPQPSVTSQVAVPSLNYNGYMGHTIVDDANISNALPGISAADGFTISVTNNGTTTDVPINFSQIQGPLTVDNIVAYVNQQLQTNGFATRFQRTITEGTINDPTHATYGIQMNVSPSETVTLSASGTPALYVAGTNGSAQVVTTTTVSTDATTGASTDTSSTGSDQQGRLVKLGNLSATPQSVFNVSVDPTTGNTTVQATAVDANGNVYLIGNATGNFGPQLNQGSSDVYLSKYDSAGNLQWTRLLGSAASASGYSLATAPTGGVVIVGSTTADLSTKAVADGNTDSFVARYDANGNQTWTQQIQTLANNQANAVSVDSSGNVYVGGQTSGAIGAGQTDSGGSDAYVTKLDSKGNIVYEQQFGTSGNDSVQATATNADGSLLVAGVQNGDAVLSKYANGDVRTAPVWQVDLGNLQGGTISGLVQSGNQVYLSGTTENASLTANGQAAIATPNSGGQNAFVFSLTDNGAGVTPKQVSYVGSANGDSTGGGVAVGPDGTVYLAGTTTGTFPGQTRTTPNTDNRFVAALDSGGQIVWTQQSGGADNQSTGTGIAIDPQGASVLDALGLPRGTVNTNNQTVDLTQTTTLRAGDSFSIDIAGTIPRTLKITIDQGETLSSLADKISGELAFSGKASVQYGSGGETLQIQVNPGVTATLVPGPTDFDALARLGIAPVTLTNSSSSTTSNSSTSSGTTPSTSSSTSSTSSTSTAQVFGLGLPNKVDISTSTGAASANAQLQSVLSAIQNVYTKTNTPAASAAAPAATSAGPVPAYLQAQVASYTDALNLLISGSSTTNNGSVSLLA
jgi:hypothetical protein